ncbi:hypothetical protein SH528x_000284 [Novipirellula sp. SH528]|uniref:hypothetical protein n=1 Tax=Novipirellula sp. SH528 TaxID=3454466 RepID=UPI003F9FE244
MQRQSQKQLTAAVAMTLAVTISASVGCVSMHHGLAEHCGIGKHKSNKSYYHCSHCGQIVANPDAKCCPHCAYVKPYYGYEPTCWNKFPEGWGCPTGAQACHPEMLEMVPQMEYSGGVPTEIQGARVEREPQFAPIAGEQKQTVAENHVAAEDEHAIPSSSDLTAPEVTPDANNTIQLNVPARKNIAKPQVPINDQTQATPVSQKRDVVTLPPMAPSLVEGMIEAPSSPKVAAKELSDVDEHDTAYTPDAMVLAFPAASASPAVTVDKVPAVTRMPLPEVVTMDKAVTLPAPADEAIAAQPQKQQRPTAQPEAKPATNQTLEFPKVQRIAIPTPKTQKLDEVASLGTANAAASRLPQPTPASTGSFDIPAEQWNKIVTMPAVANTTPSMPPAAGAENYEMKKSFEPVSVETNSPRLVPSMSHLPNRVATIPVDETINIRSVSESKSNIGLPTPVRRIPVSDQQLANENPSTAAATDNVVPTSNVAPVVNRVPLPTKAPANVAPQYAAPNRVNANLYPAPANRIQIPASR